jgi:SSS family solute:Na+ symporter
MTSPIALAMIALYLVLTTLVGMVMVRRSRGSDEWSVAGGRMGILMIGVGIAGTRIGGAATYGVAGDVVTGGVWNMWWYGISTILAMALVGAFFAVPYRRLRIQTVGEIFRLRFNSRRCQWLTSFCVQTEYLIVNIIEPYIIGRILATVTGMPFGAAVAVGGLTLVSYTALGGLWGSAATNLIHCATIIVGFVAVGAAGVGHLGGWEQIAGRVDAALAAASIDSAVWWGFAGAGWVAAVGMVFSAAIHTPAASIYVNFATAARSERAVLPAFMLGGLIAAPMPLLAGWIGIETLAQYGARAQISSYQTITRLATEINPWIGGIALAAVLAAVISSGGPILLSSATMLVRDWLPQSAAWPQERRLHAYRVATVAYGAVAALIAWLGPIGSVLGLLLFGFAMVVPPAIAVGYTLYWPRTTEAGAFWGIALGYGSGLGWYLFAPGDIDPSYATTLIPLLVIPLVSLLTPERVDGRDAFYRAIAGRPGVGAAAARAGVS